MLIIAISDHDDQNKNVACSAPHKLFENRPDLLEAETPLVKKNYLGFNKYLFKFYLFDLKG